MERRIQTRIALFGMGCTGSYTAQLLVQNGIRAMDLIDTGKIALTKNGCYKRNGNPEIMKFRVDEELRNLKRINPAVEIAVRNLPVTEAYLESVPSGRWDYIIDFLDSAEIMRLLASYAKKNNIGFIGCLNLTNCLDASKVRISPVDEIPDRWLSSGLYEISPEIFPLGSKLVYSEETSRFSETSTNYQSCADCACPPYIALSCSRRKVVYTSCDVYVSAMAGMLVSQEILLRQAICV